MKLGAKSMNPKSLGGRRGDFEFLNFVLELKGLLRNGRLF